MRLANAIVLMMVLVYIPVAPFAQGQTPASIEILADAESVTTDGLINFEAIVRDSSGQVIDYDVTWSSSNGTINQEGQFIGWTAGMVNITAKIGGINATQSVTVTPGWARNIVSDISTNTVAIDETLTLSAYLVDRGENQVPGDVSWRSITGFINAELDTWTPSELGSTELMITWYELETVVNITVTPGAPSEIQFSESNIVQSGSTIQLSPNLVDAYGNEMPLAAAGSLYWYAENGEINSQGDYLGDIPGLWNVSLNSSSGANGTAQIRVIPAQAVDLHIELGSTEIRAGIPIELKAMRTDIYGYTAQVPVSIGNWTIGSGSLQVDGDVVFWTPFTLGSATIAVIDQGFSATYEVVVFSGPALHLEIIYSESSINSGEQIVVQAAAVDSVGTHRIVDASFIFSSELNPSTLGNETIIQPGPIGNYSVEATWYDNESDNTLSAISGIEVLPGGLARIQVLSQGIQVPSDEAVDLSPKFYDAYGNNLPPIMANWTIEGEDKTLELKISNYYWSPPSLGTHQMKIMADGVYAVVDVEVVPGKAHQLRTSIVDRLTVVSGKSESFSIYSIDINGYEKPTDDVRFELNEDAGEIVQAVEGSGAWEIIGKSAGIWDIRAFSGNASHQFSIEVLPGDPTRIVLEFLVENPQQNADVLMLIKVLDNADNEVSIDDNDFSVGCTTGDVSFVHNGTWEVETQEAGDDHACTVKLNELVAQKFFDVQPVLLGGNLGDTNAALSFMLVIMMLIGGILLIVIRRLTDDDDTEKTWDDFESEYQNLANLNDMAMLGDESQTSDADEDEKEQPTLQSAMVSSAEDPYQSMTPTQGYESPEDIRQRLTLIAQQTGITQAAPGTVQGKTGWYVDAKGVLSAWKVDANGNWEKIDA